MPPTRPARLQLLTEILARIARGLVLALLIVAPWPYAMAEWSSQVWLVPVVGAILVLASLVALLRRHSVGNPLVWSLSVVLAIGLLQVVPLPEPLWQMLAPLAGFEQKVDQWTSEFAESGGADSSTAKSDSATAETQKDEPGNSSGEEGDSQTESSQSNQSSQNAQTDAERRATLDYAVTGRTLSIDPLQTRTTVCVFAMGLAMLLSCTILFRDRRSVSLLLGALMLSGVAIALLGVYQAVVAGPWTFINVPKASSFATFYSRNSAPQFLACCFGATGGLLGLYRANKSKRDQDKRYPPVNIVARLRRRVEDFVTEADPLSFVLLIVMVLLFASVLISNSRGGTLAFFASGLTVLLVYSLGKEASFGSSIAVFLLVVCSGLFLSLYGLDELVGARLGTLSREAHQLDNPRLTLWVMALSQPSCWLLGSGLGTFHFALLPLYATPQYTWFCHAENIYIELASGAGMLTLLIALAGLLWLIWQLLSRSAQSSTGRSTRFACFFAVLAVALHNLVDFSLILPAVFLPMACLVGTYLGTRHQVRQKVRKSRRSRSSSSESPAKRRGPRIDLDADGNESQDLDSAESFRDDRERYAQRRKHHLPAGSERRSLAASASPKGITESPLPDASFPSTPNPDAMLEPRWAPLTLIVCLLLISAAVGLGYRPLSASAFAEKMDKSPPPDSDLAELIRSATSSQWAAFPESRLQIGRWRQELAREQLLDSPRWPAEISGAMRNALSNPEFFNTAFHATADPELQELREKVLDQEPSVLKNLADSQADMRTALAACPLDWRASWGILRSDLGEMTAEQRRRNYARILLTARNNPPVLQAAGTHALMIGDVPAGMELWRQLLPESDGARTQILNLVGRFLTTDQLVAILPENPMHRIEMAWQANRRGATVVADAILDATDLDRAFETAHFAADWPQVAWCAAQKKDIQREIEAWEKATRAEALNLQLSFELAGALQRGHRPKEALIQIEDALDRSPDNTDFQTLKDKLIQEIKDDSTSK